MFWLERGDFVNLAHVKWRDAHTAKFLGTLSDAKRILADISSALSHLRTKGYFHNDIKPSNMVYGRQSGAKLLDFGHATRDDEPCCKGGSPWYIPPEFLALRERKGPADIWALGIVMLYLLQRIPLPDTQRQVRTWLINEVRVPGDNGPATSAMENWLRLVSGERERLGALEDGREVTELVQRMLEPDVLNRISTQELASIVREW
jgi:serine/threonine protein kinase